jgi:RNA polymerase sigma-70 factor (ECF subfamily)
MRELMEAPQETLPVDNTPAYGGGEAGLVEAARQGNQQAFGELVERYQRRLVRVIHQLVHNLDLAEDLAQDTFLKVYQRLDQFDPSRRFGPWLFQVGVNHTLDHLRKQKRRGWWMLFSEAGEDRPTDPAVSDPRLNLDLAQEVDQTLAELPEKDRVVLVLREMENMSTSEIAAILGRKEATVRWRLAEARQKFEQIWTQRRDGRPPRPSRESTPNQ